MERLSREAVFARDVIMVKSRKHPLLKRLTADGAIVLSFVAALEIVIMISPFAFYFYAVFNPLLLTLNQLAATRWLTAFFLPHMIVPPNGFLLAVRILGSALCIAGTLIFLICAAQVYLGKMLKKGTATKGFYAVVRHPQYVGLTLAAAGLAILWPRFLTLVLLAVMIFLYFLLAKDEERRMANRFGDSYASYLNRTGMFLPRTIERVFIKAHEPGKPFGFLKSAVLLGTLLVAAVGLGFAFRSYTVHHLPFTRIGTVDVVTIVPDDSTTAKELVPAVLQDSLVSADLASLSANTNSRILAYFIPIDYVMQGMIANTGDEWKLFQHHRTLGMITDYILHPVGHLGGAHAHHMMAGVKHGPEMYDLPMMKRRVIFIEVADNGRELRSPFDDFGINVQRTPRFFVDVHLHTAEILQVRDTPTGSGWGTVPTPTF
jgi:protein-S-isoprenylcysteine O-methyltransferase Ste14